nr:MAG TPA: RNA polymerase sigma-H factor [Bacteriophage sp.]
MIFFSNLQNRPLTAAIEKHFEISAKEMPNVVKLLQASSIICKKILNKGRLNMASYNLKKQISFFDQAMKEVLKKNKNYKGESLIDFVSPDTNFTFMALKMANKYLNYYNSDEDKYNILIEAFTNQFLDKDKMKKTLYDFDGYLYDYVDGKYVNPTPIKIEAYISTLFSRAVIAESQKLSEDYSKRKAITPFEDESDEDAFDRAVDKTVSKFNADDEVMWDQLMKDVEHQFKQEFAKDKFPDRPLYVLKMLLLGYSKTEIAQELNLSNTRVGDMVWYMKKAVKDLAKKYADKGDSTLLLELEKNFDKK